MLQNWPRNASNTKDNEYETLVLAYSRKLDSLMLASCITRSPKEEESSPPHTEDVLMDSKEEIENTLPPFQGYAGMDSENMAPTPTPQSAMGSNKFNDSPMEPGSTQYI